MRFERSFKGYMFGYGKSDDPTGEVKKIRGSTSHLVSSDGRVKMSEGRWTQGYRHIVKSQKGDRCYRRVDMTLVVDGKSIKNRAYVHVLVAEAFIGERPNGYQVDHIDGFEGNNDVSNLRYLSPSDNNKMAFASGQRLPPGEKPVLLIKLDGTFLRFKSSSEGARQMGVNVATVSINCSTGRKNRAGNYWAHDKPVVKLGGDEFESLPKASGDTGESILSILMSCRNTDDESWTFVE
ncbi:EsV-1-119 [Ectocarpus siliculosus]|uniref:EsV-1-119 n=1 Tax=Ectocarpus siliculosus TaxID=2880 RepID=D8LPE7_ECTSI|nr:EsV-1-119 [Ectocarpus siliculosus]|eukprot:CBN80419.1 EsV-1-119 [Ectocarpus siliculosus]